MRRISVRGIVLHEGKLLCVKLKAYDGSIQDKTPYWCLPGGGLDDGEALTDGIKREMLEETAIEPVVGDLLYVHQFSFDGKEYLEFFFHITNDQDYLSVDLSETSHGTEEIAEIDFIDPAASHILPKFLSKEQLTDLVRQKSPTRIVSTDL